MERNEVLLLKFFQHAEATTSANQGLVKKIDQVGR